MGGRCGSVVSEEKARGGRRLVGRTGARCAPPPLSPGAFGEREDEKRETNAFDIDQTGATTSDGQWQVQKHGPEAETRSRDPVLSTVYRSGDKTSTRASSDRA